MKWLGKGLTALALCCLLFGNIVANAEESSSTTIDFVLVMDCTGSLVDSDPDKWGVEAAKLFVETLPTENVRVSVIGFGAKWDDNEVYIIKNSGRSFSRVTEAFPLSKAGSEAQNDKICKVLEQIGDETGDYTQIGNALSAAVDVLEQGEADQDAACIILVSDGRITGQGDQTEPEEIYERYESIENAISTASLKEWPVYCLELNYDGLNGGSDWQGMQAREQLEHISERTGGKRIEVTGTDTILSNFTEIIKRYFDVESGVEKFVIHDKKVTKAFHVAEMTAETNIIISGEKLDCIDRIAITNPDMDTKEYRANSRTDSRRVIFNSPHYILGKLVNPQPGDWLVTVYGDDGVEIAIQIIPLQEIDLKLNTLKDLSEGIYRNEPVEFTAHFIYNDQSYSSDTFYRNSKAYLEIVETGNKFPMEGGTDNYKGTISFERAGTYTVRAVVEDGIFRNDRKVSGNYNIDVKVESVPSLLAQIPDQTMAVGSTLTLDCSEYFSGGDKEQTSYSVSFDKTMPLEWNITPGGLLRIKAGERTGTVQISISQKDKDLEDEVSQQFTLVVTNERPQIQGEEQISIELISGDNVLLEKLAPVLEVNPQKEVILELDTYFKDPENLPLRYQREYEAEMGDFRPFTAEVNEKGQCVLQAKESGAGIVYLQAVDCCEELSDKITVCVNVVGSGTFFFRQTGGFWIILLLVVLVMAAFGVVLFWKRKLYGSWLVTVNYGVNMEGPFTQYKQGMKAKCKLSELVNAMQPCDFQSGDVMICAGNNINKKVILKELDKCSHLKIKKNDEELKEVQRLVFTKDSQDLIELIDKNGVVVRLQRIG